MKSYRYRRPPHREWEPEPLYLPLDPPPPLEKRPEEKAPPRRVIIIPIASPDDGIPMC